MENKISYSLQNAKDSIAQKRGYESWYYVDFNAENEESMRDEAAELYKEKSTEELRKENEALKSDIEMCRIQRTWDDLQTIEYMKMIEEIERLKESNKELIEKLSKISSYEAGMSEYYRMHDYRSMHGLWQNLINSLKSKP